MKPERPNNSEVSATTASSSPIQAATAQASTAQAATPWTASAQASTAQASSTQASTAQASTAQASGSSLSLPVLDCHSYFLADHPITRPGTYRYLLAPPISAEGANLSAFRSRVDLLDRRRLGGGLLPVQGLDDPTFDRALDDPFWRGLLLTPVYARGVRLDDALVQDRLHRPRACEMPVMIEAGVEGYSRPIQLERFLLVTPPRPIVLTHGGQLNISGSHLSAAASLFQEHAHTLLETSGIYRQDFLEEQLATLGSARILYGSGAPWMDERLELERVRILPVDEASRRELMGGNAARVFRVES